MRFNKLSVALIVGTTILMSFEIADASAQVFRKRCNPCQRIHHRNVCCNFSSITVCSNCVQSSCGNYTDWKWVECGQIQYWLLVNYKCCRGMNCSKPPFSGTNPGQVVRVECFEPTRRTPSRAPDCGWCLYDGSGVLIEKHCVDNGPQPCGCANKINDQFCIRNTTYPLDSIVKWCEY